MPTSTRSLPGRVPRAILYLLCAIQLLCLSACLFVVPHPMTTKDKSVSGEFIKPNIEFAKVGVTTRSEIEQTLAPFSAFCKSDRLFWARWAQSTHGITAGFAVPAAGAVGGTDRSWSIQNIFYFFDESGKLTSIDRFDDSLLSLKLNAAHSTLGQTSPQLAQPTNIQVLHLKDGIAHTATLRLSGDMLEIVEDGGAHSVSLNRGEISKVTTSGGDAETSCLPNCTDQILKFTRSTNTGKQATLQFALADFETFVWWFQQQRR